LDRKTVSTGLSTPMSFSHDSFHSSNEYILIIDHHPYLEMLERKKTK
jgi:hypothetical protein